jgi:hypothetical protein
MRRQGAYLSSSRAPPTIQGTSFWAVLRQVRCTSYLSSWMAGFSLPSSRVSRWRQQSTAGKDTAKATMGRSLQNTTLGTVHPALLFGSPSPQASDWGNQKASGHISRPAIRRSTPISSQEVWVECGEERLRLEHRVALLQGLGGPLHFTIHLKQPIRGPSKDSETAFLGELRRTG